MLRWIEYVSPHHLHRLAASFGASCDLSYSAAPRFSARLAESTGGKRATFKNPEQKLWLDRMAAKGWTAPTWPREYGGGGLSSAESRVLTQELGRIKARPALMSFGIWMLGPVLLEYANEEQKQKFLPQIVRGEIRRC